MEKINSLMKKRGLSPKNLKKNAFLMFALLLSLVLSPFLFQDNLHANQASPPPDSSKGYKTMELEEVFYDKFIKTLFLYTKGIAVTIDRIRDFTLTSPPRIVVDLINTKYRPAKQTIDINTEEIARIRIAQNSPQIVRIVIDFNNEISDYKIYTDNKGIFIALNDESNDDKTSIPEKSPDFFREHNPTTEKSELLKQAISAEVTKNWRHALTIYEKYLNKYPTDVDILRRKADIHFKLGDYKNGILTLEKIADLKPGGEVFYHLSQAYSMSSQPEKSLEAINKALKYNPYNKEYLESQAIIATWVGEYDIAKRAYRTLLNLYPKGKNYLLKIGNIMLWTGDTDEAVYYYSEYLKHNPEDIDAIFNLVRAQSFRGNYDAAINLLERYKKLKGKDTRYVQELSRALIFAGRAKSGLEIIEEELKREPDNYESNVLKTFALLNSRRYNEVIPSLEKTVELDPQNHYNEDFKRFTTANIRSNLNTNTGIYLDSDDIVITHQRIHLKHMVSRVTSLNYVLLADQLTADKNSPFSRKSGEDYIYHLNGLVGIEHFFNPDFNLKTLIGISVTDEDFSPSYNVSLYYWPAEAIRLSMESSLNYYLVSPLSVEENVRRFSNGILIDYSPFINSSIKGRASINFYTDKNSQWELFLNPRVEILRLEHLNFDLGASGYWFGFDKDLDNGYFDPGFYQRYLVHGYGYIKINDDNGIAFNGGMGTQEDDISNDFSFSANLALQVYIGIYRDWYLRVGGSYYNTRLPSGAFDAFSFSLKITKRF